MRKRRKRISLLFFQAKKYICPIPDELLMLCAPLSDFHAASFLLDFSFLFFLVLSCCLFTTTSTTAMAPETAPTTITRSDYSASFLRIPEICQQKTPTNVNLKNINTGIQKNIKNMELFQTNPKCKNIKD
jgi:hypothetical protein